ncbi:MAG: hypothetical protein E4G96_03345, partial [Chrysiogenales bacterium]
MSVGVDIQRPSSEHLLPALYRAWRHNCKNKIVELFLVIFAVCATMGAERMMRIFALSDIHGDERHFDAAAPLMESADVVVISGDLMRAYSTRSAERILTRIERHARRIIAVPGNWDRDEVRLLLDERGYDVHGRGRSIDGIG